MKRFLVLSGMIFVSSVLIVGGLILVVRHMDLPADLRSVGFSRCESANCLSKSSGITDLNVHPVTVAWVVAWLGGPCDVQMTGFGATLRFPTAYVYAYSKQDHIRENDKVWAIIILPNVPTEVCDRTQATWHGFIPEGQPDPFAGPDLP